MNSHPSLKPLMILGTSSGVGKSILVAGLCRIFLQDGLHPAPFKAQNMSLNSFITPEGDEIGRAQAVQAEASGIPPHRDMNPVLLKPSGTHRSQVILQGRVAGEMTALEYFRAGKTDFFTPVLESFRSLKSRYHPIVLEGAGGIAELNLKDRDIVNLPMARAAGAIAYLVADIERGGVFASLFGTLELLTPEERSMIRGVIVNRFRGDATLFEEGRSILERITGLPVLGVIPYLDKINIDEEDSLDMDKYETRPAPNRFNVAVLRLDRLSNYTDFSRLSRLEGIHLFYTDHPEDLKKADLLILPGTKNTIEDLEQIRNNGCADAILEFAKKGGTVLGICGGFQMLGEQIVDPEHLESDRGEIQGLGLLPVSTTLQSPKLTRQVEFFPADFPESRNPEKASARGYEIHMGRTEIPSSISPLFRIREGDNLLPEGIHRERILGTYIHGCLDDLSITRYILSRASGIDVPWPELEKNSASEDPYDRLANHLRNHLDIDRIYRDMEGEERIS